MEEPLAPKSAAGKASAWVSEQGSKTAIQLADISADEQQRSPLQDQEMNRVLGGGLVPGAVVLLAGEPGIGKSTLLLQVALQQADLVTLYVSGEESAAQIKWRAGRIANPHNNFYLLTDTDTRNLLGEAKKIKPDLVVIDSIQTLESPMLEGAAGSVGQIRQSTADIIRFAKETATTVMLIGHITKDGQIAGPKILEHMVDTVLQFEGDRHYAYRMVRTLKNRYGSTSELGIYEMTDRGMRPVSNPSEMLLHRKDEDLSGSAIAAIMEGIRPLMVEVQALVTPSVYGTPQRTASGFDMRRLQLLLAVLDKRGGFQFGGRDVFLNIAGGLRIEDPASDLAAMIALLSSYNDVAVPPHYCFAGEVGLSGEIRAVNRLEQRIAEAARLGFEKIYVSAIATVKSKNTGIEVVNVSKVEDLYQLLF